MTDDIPHLRQIDKEIADALCARVRALDGLPMSIRQEMFAFEGERTPHDATRLANAIQNWPWAADNKDAKALIRDLDQAAEDCAGLVPTNRQRRA